MKRILVVEDEEAISLALTDWITHSHKGYEVVLAGDGIEALEKVGAQKFDLILLDIVLPKMDGYVFLEELKKRKVDTKVVVISNLSEKEEIQRALDLGAVEFFVKTETNLASISEVMKKIFGETE